MATENAILQPGVILDSGTAKYSIIDVLGQGGFGITYLVMAQIMSGNVPIEAKFAIKEHFPTSFCERIGNNVVALPDKAQDYEKSKDDFMAEAKKLHDLGAQNDNIVKVNEVFEANGTAYYVMQYINGVSLSEYVKAKKKISFQEAISILSPIFDAVDFLHKSRINHLDIKPENIMLHNGINGTTVPILIDFGLSVHFNKSGSKTSPKGVQGISEGFSPIEQYAEISEFIPATDIYALAATLIFAVTGKIPKGAAELKLSDVRSDLDGIVPDDAIDGICKALNKSFEDRTGSIKELKQDLGLNKGKTVVISNNNNKKITKNIIICIAIVLAISAAAYFLWPKSDNLDNPNNPNQNATTQQTTQEQQSHGSELSNQEKTDSVSPIPEKPQQQTQQQEQAPQQNQTQTEINEHAQNNSHADSQVNKPNITDGTLNLGYGTWKGGIKNGKPHGDGKLVFHTKHKVDRKSDYYADEGYYLVATYENGSLINGNLYDSNGKIIATIIP